MQEILEQALEAGLPPLSPEVVTQAKVCRSLARKDARTRHKLGEELEKLHDVCARHGNGTFDRVVAEIVGLSKTTAWRYRLDHCNEAQLTQRTEPEIVPDEVTSSTGDDVTHGGKPSVSVQNGVSPLGLTISLPYNEIVSVETNFRSLGKGSGCNVEYPGPVVESGVTSSSLNLPPSTAGLKTSAGKKNAHYIQLRIHPNLHKGKWEDFETARQGLSPIALECTIVDAVIDKYHFPQHYQAHYEPVDSAPGEVTTELTKASM